MSAVLTALSRDQESRLRARFRLATGPELLITSGRHKLVLLSGNRAFAFPRGADRVHMIEREAAVLDAVDLTLAPRPLGLHRDEQIWPYPSLEMTRLPGRVLGYRQGQHETRTGNVGRSAGLGRLDGRALSHPNL